MNRQKVKAASTGDAWRAWLHPRVLTMLFFGFSAGLPILLIFSTLSVWLTEAGVARSTVTFFSWAALGYSFKFTWAPVVDRLPLPLLTRRLGRRRGWLLVAQGMIMTAIGCMAFTDPVAGERGLWLMACAAVLLGFSSATQDVVIDAYRIECAPEPMQAMLSASYIAGYRIGMLTAGAGGLYLASFFGASAATYSYGAWRLTYLAMMLAMLVGVATTLLVPEPERNLAEARREYSGAQYARFLLLFAVAVATFVAAFLWSGNGLKGAVKGLLEGAGLHSALATFLTEALRLGLGLGAAMLAAWLTVAVGLADREMAHQTWVMPVADFFHRYGLGTALLLLALVGFYRISDIVLGVISNVFYLDLGFSKNVIATITKTFGLLMTIAGGFVGGMLSLRLGVMAVLFLGALLSAVTNLLFLLLAQSGANVSLLTVVIAADNLSAGLAGAAFVAFLSSLTSVSFTAVQYAIFSSLMTLFPKLIGGYSGSIVSAWNYEAFFLLTTAMGLPVLLLVWWAGRLLAHRQPGGDAASPDSQTPPGG